MVTFTDSLHFLSLSICNEPSNKWCRLSPRPHAVQVSLSLCHCPKCQISGATRFSEFLCSLFKQGCSVYKHSSKCTKPGNSWLGHPIVTDYTTFLLSVHQGDPERMVFQCLFTQTPRELLFCVPSRKHQENCCSVALHANTRMEVWIRNSMCQQSKLNHWKEMILLAYNSANSTAHQSVM